jgi:hypothetical protein
MWMRKSVQEPAQNASFDAGMVSESTERFGGIISRGYRVAVIRASKADGYRGCAQADYGRLRQQRCARNGRKGLAGRLLQGWMMVVMPTCVGSERKDEDVVFDRSFQTPSRTKPYGERPVRSFQHHSEVVRPASSQEYHCSFPRPG